MRCGHRAGCAVPPISAKFYPFWTLGSAAQGSGYYDGLHSAYYDGSLSSLCAWNFGDVLPSTKRDLGRDAQYGTPDVARYGGTIISQPMANPQLSTRCGSTRY